MKILTIGSALIDVFLNSTDFKINEAGKICVGVATGKMDIKDFILKTGGGAGNCAAAFAKLGHEVAVIAELGQDNLADLVLKDLISYGITTDFLIREKTEATGGSVILVADNGERVVLVHRGAAAMLDPQDIDLKKVETFFGKLDWLHLSSIAGQLETLKHIFKKAKAQQIKLSWNPGTADLRLVADGKLALGDLYGEILFLNQEEWALISSQQDRLLNIWSQLVITNGQQGGQVLLNNGEKFAYEAVKVKAVNVTGAGDAFASAYVAAILENKTPREAALWGAKN